MSDLAEEVRFELTRAFQLRNLANSRNGPYYATPPSMFIIPLKS